MIVNHFLIKGKCKGNNQIEKQDTNKFHTTEELFIRRLGSDLNYSTPNKYFSAPFFYKTLILFIAQFVDFNIIHLKYVENKLSHIINAGGVCLKFT